MRQQQGYIYGTLLEDEGAAACSYNAKKHTHTNAAVLQLHQPMNSWSVAEQTNSKYPRMQLPGFHTD